ncbi:MAG: hypothetical protein KBA81_06885 [Rhabdochlamydiaceae bacterium]|nr:hypothetical protein [Rhabdochlamydiaceae bacterium]
MTTQKTPEEIADDIVREWYGTSGCQQIYEGIVKAIKSERERRIIPDLDKVKGYLYDYGSRNYSTLQINEIYNAVKRLSEDIT